MVTSDVAAPETVTDVARNSRIDTPTLRNIETLDDALKVLQDAGISIKDATEVMGDGFELLEDNEKPQLEGLGFVVLEGTQSDGDYGRFTSLRIVTKNGRKIILNDGGTGIHKQVTDYLADNSSVVGLYVPNGLRSSKFMFCEECKNVEKQGTSACTKCSHSPLKPATTFYLDLSK